MADDIVTRLRMTVQNQHGEWNTLTEAADQIEQLRREAQAFTVKPDEVLVLIAPDGTTFAEAERMADIPALNGRVVVLSGLGARRG